MIIHHIPFQTMVNTLTWSKWIEQGRPGDTFSNYLTIRGYKTRYGNSGYHITCEKEEELTWFLLIL